MAGLSAGLSGWWRPEGFVLSIFAELIVPFSNFQTDRFGPKLRIQKKEFLTFCLPYALSVMIWISFRILYFGNLLPTSGVLKAEAGIHPLNSIAALEFYFKSLLPLLVLFVFVALLKNLSRVWILMGFLVLVSLIWMPITTTLDWWNRMQWPIIPVIAFLVTSMIAQNSTLKRQDRIFFQFSEIFVVFALFLSPLMVVHGSPLGYFPPFTSAVSEAIHGVNTSEIRLATTEAGLIPLSISGKVLDTYGWNNRIIAETNGDSLIPELERFKPNMLVVHGRTPDGLGNTNCKFNYFQPNWDRMVTKLYAFAETHRFRLYRSTEAGPCDAWSIFIAKDVSEQVRQALISYRVPGRELVTPTL